jgi:HK97 family phage major capsid protein
MSVAVEVKDLKSMSLPELQDELKHRQVETAKIFNEKGQNLTMDDLDVVQFNHNRMNDLGTAIDRFKELSKYQEANEARMIKAGQIERSVPFAGGRGEDLRSGPDPVQFKDLGTQFVESIAFKDYNKNKKEGPSIDFESKTVFQMTTANSGSIGYAPQIIRNGVIVEYPVRKPKMDGLLPLSRTTAPAIMYQEETVWVNGAIAVHEDDLRAGESEFKLEDKTETVKKIRVSLPISDDMMDDAPYMQDYVNNRLVTQLSLKKDQDLLTGDGVGDNLLGLLNRANILTRAVAQGEASTDAIHRGMTQILLTSEYSPNGIVMHPIDWENIRLMKTADGVYIYGPPTEMGPMRLWGIDVVDTKAISQGISLIGAFDAACTQAMRKDITLSVATEHADNWLRGRVVIKAELRVALVVYRPSSLLKLTGLPVS